MWGNSNRDVIEKKEVACQDTRVAAAARVVLFTKNT